MAINAVTSKREEKLNNASKKRKIINRMNPNILVFFTPHLWGQVDKLGWSNFRSLISKGKVAAITKKYLCKPYINENSVKYFPSKLSGKKTVINTQLNATK